MADNFNCKKINNKDLFEFGRYLQNAIYELNKAEYLAKAAEGIISYKYSIVGNKIFEELVDEYASLPQSSGVRCNWYRTALSKGAMFDARCFNIPREEVTNCIYWRQLDATRNSIQMIGQANFSHGELQEKTCNMIQDMLMEQKGINWNDYPAYLKRGTAVIKEEYLTENDSVRTRWVVDLDMPQLKGENREYLERLIRYE